MSPGYSIKSVLNVVLWYLGAWALLGWLLDLFWPTVTVGLSLLLAWHYYFQFKLLDWLWHRRTLLPPRARGSWSFIYDGIYRTQRKAQQRRRNLAQLLRRFRDAAEAIPDAAIVFRRGGELVWCNKLGQLLFGLKWPADSGIRLASLIRHPEFNRYLKKGDFSHEFYLPSPAREEIELEVRIMPYSADQYLLIARDITQIRKLEKMRKDFVANVSHELRTPLTVIQGYLEILASDPENSAGGLQEKAVKEMSSQSDRMRNLVEQLLSLSRIESQRIDIFEKVVDVPELLHRLQNDAQQLNSEKRHNITFEIAPQKMYGHENELRSAFSNLLSNAIHYTPAGGCIKVSWRAVGQQMEFSVSDNGPGIAADHLPRLTERFYRVDRDRNSRKGGSGLGLAIVKHALERHHCKLSIRSEVDSGSTFSVRVPENLIVQV